ncbi:MAG TPA: hypothetical protein PLQ14_15785 [Actinomycetota bacterium]|nr:hypothetical protein [Actinomycetota bacterium]
MGFAYERRGHEVLITHHHRPAATLRCTAVIAFLAAIESGDDQLVRARATGNYRRGNERAAKNHPRNGGR